MKEHAREKGLEGAPVDEGPGDEPVRAANRAAAVDELEGETGQIQCHENEGHEGHAG